MQKISREEFQKRLDQINELFASIVAHAQHQSTHALSLQKPL